MGTIIQWADWVGVQEAIGQATKMVSGLSPSQAETAMGFVKVIMNDGTVRFVLNSARTITQQGNVIQFPGADAAQAFNDYIANGGLATATGAAATGTAVAQSSNLTMLSGAGGATGIGGLLSMALPTAAAAIAPLAGAALGIGLYDLNPDFWEKISRALLPWAYPDTELLPVVADGAGNTYFSEDAIDAVKKELAVQQTTMAKDDLPENLKGNLNPDTEYPFQFSYKVAKFRVDTKSSDLIGEYTNKTAVVFNKPVSVLFTGPRIQGSYWFIASSNEEFEISAISGTPAPIFDLEVNTKATKITRNGKTAYYIAALFGLVGGMTSIMSNEVKSTILRLKGNNNLPEVQSDIAWVMQNGSAPYYEQGTQAWTGAEYPLTPVPIEVITNIDNTEVETKKYYPIAVPTGQPGVTVTPQEFPDLTQNPNPYPAISPWITTTPSPSEYPNNVPQSKPAPLPNPVPEYTPNLNPDTDPSQQPAPQPDPEPATPRPGSTGNTPTLPLPVSPSFSSGQGLIHVYRCAKETINAFGAWLWTTFSGDIIETVTKLFNNPMDAVIGIHELYYPPNVGDIVPIRAGYLTSNVNANLISTRYGRLNCGSIVVPEYYGNYLDYSPYTKCSLYLPFVGIVPVLADDIIGNSVNISYNIDTYTGCCIAVVTVAREGYSATVYQFEGNCAVEVPITSGYHAALMSAMLGIAGTAISGSPHVGLAASNLGRASLGKNDVSHSGSFGASYGAMGIKKPYVIVKRPTQKSVVNYNQEYGFPAHKRVTIGSCSGYLRAREVHVISPTATDEEKARIEELLKGGVFVK